MLLNLIFDDSGVDDGSITAAYQVGPYVVQIKQKPGEGHAIEHNADGTGTDTPAAAASTAAAASPAEAASAGSSSNEAYPNVGLMVWQSAFVLAEYLLRNPPAGGWKGVRVVEVGCGVGIAGIALGAAGARVTMTDLEHITPLAQENVDANASLCQGNVDVAPFPWGQDPASAGLAPPEVLVAADCLYEPKHYDNLLDSLVRLSTPSTQLYFCYRHRGSYNEETFEPMALRAGFSVEHVPDEQLGQEYRGRGFHLFRMQRTSAPQPAS